MLCGYEVALIPMQVFEDGSVQWHFMSSHKGGNRFRWLQHREEFLKSIPTDRGYNVDVGRLKGTAYVGWTRSKIRILVGELEPPEQITRSSLSRSSYKYVPSGREGQVTIQLNPVFALSALLDFTKTYKRIGLVTAFSPSGDFRSLIDEPYSSDVIIYSAGTKTGLLCMAIHIMIFLVRVYPRKHKYALKDDFFNQLSNVEYGQEALRGFGDKEVANGLTFGDILTQVSSRYLSINAIIPESARTASKMLLGFEIADLMDNNRNCSRELPVSDGVETWAPLAANVDIVFCKDIGELEKLEDVTDTAECDQAPAKNSNTLVVPLSRITNYFYFFEGGSYRRTGMGNGYWTILNCSFTCPYQSQRHGRECWKFRLQSIKRGTETLRKRKRDTHVIDEETMRNGGAVVFGRL